TRRVSYRRGCTSNPEIATTSPLPSAATSFTQLTPVALKRKGPTITAWFLRTVACAGPCAFASDICTLVATELRLQWPGGAGSPGGGQIQFTWIQNFSSTCGITYPMASCALALAQSARSITKKGVFRMGPSLVV